MECPEIEVDGIGLLPLLIKARSLTQGHNTLEVGGVCRARSKRVPRTKEEVVAR